LALAPHHAKAHHMLGLVLHWMNRSEEAVPVLEEAVRLAPSLHEARIDLGRAYLGAGRYLAAQNVLEPLLQADAVNVRAHIFYGIACHELGKFREAVQHFEKAIVFERDPA